MATWSTNTVETHLQSSVDALDAIGTSAKDAVRVTESAPRRSDGRTLAWMSI